jgi:hypothetical protein
MDEDDTSVPTMDDTSSSSADNELSSLDPIHYSFVPAHLVNASMAPEDAAVGSASFSLILSGLDITVDSPSSPAVDGGNEDREGDDNEGTLEATAFSIALAPLTCPAEAGGICKALDGVDVLAMLPTGSGKIGLLSTHCAGIDF